MFKKVKYNNGKRELYLFNKKIFEYLRHSQFANFVKQRLDEIAGLTQNSTPLDTAKLVFDSQGGGGAAFTPLTSC